MNKLSAPFQGSIFTEWTKKMFQNASKQFDVIG